MDEKEPKVVFRRDAVVTVNGFEVGTLRKSEGRAGTFWSLKNRFTGHITAPRDNRWRVEEDARDIYQANRARLP